MDTSDVKNVIKQSLKDADGIVAALSSLTVSPQVCSRKLCCHNDTSKRLEQIFLRYVDRLTLASPRDKYPIAAAWIQPYFDLNVYPRLRILLEDASAKIKFVTAAVGPRESLLRTSQAVALCAFPATGLLERLLVMANALVYNGQAYEGPLLEEVTSQLLSRDLLDPLSGAIRSTITFTAFMRTREAIEALTEFSFETAPAELRAALACAGTQGSVASMAAATGAKYALFAAQVLMVRLSAITAPGARLSDQLFRRLEAFAASDLLPAVAVGILDHPPLDTDERSSMLSQLHVAAREAMQAVTVTYMAFARLHAIGGQWAHEVAGLFARLLHHPDVRRLQEASLERLLLHAGLQDAPGSVSGSSGPPDWWLVREEAATGYFFGVPPGGGGFESQERLAVWLEDDHCQAICASLAVWRDDNVTGAVAGNAPDPSAGPSAASSAGGSAAARALRPPPPPLQLARCTARAAEALVRLCRGRGMRGAYTRAPTWLAARMQMLLYCLDMSSHLQGLSPGVSRECLPYWLEAAAWGLALAAEAEAAIGGEDAPKDPPRTFLANMFGDGAPTGGVVAMLRSLLHMCADKSKGLASLSEELRADCRERLRRAGLAASLDRVLRLAFTAQDRGTPAAQVLEPALSIIATLVREQAVSFLQPSRAASQPSTQPPQGGASSGSGGAQLGLLVTAAKRACLLAPALAASPAAGSSREARERHQGLVDTANLLLELLHRGAEDIHVVLRARLKTSTPGMPSVADGAAAGTDPWDRADASCPSEAHEALTYVARGTSALAASLAHMAAHLVASGEAQTGVGLLRFTTAATSAVYNLLRCTRPPLALPAAQLLACQPHRLITSACGLLAAAGTGPVRMAKELAAVVAQVVVALAARKHVAPHMLEWLAPASPPPPPSAGGAATPPGGSATRGCLVAPLRSILPHLLQWSRAYAGYVLALLRLAEDTLSQLPPGQPGGGAVETGFGSGAADGGFGRTVAVMASIMLDDDRMLVGARDVELPDGSTVFGLLEQAEAGRPAACRSVVAPTPPPLPPLLACPAAPAAAFRRLYVCGNPACVNFQRAAEERLDLKKCAGCRAVRYCCVECQRAHWRGAHKLECKGLQGN